MRWFALVVTVLLAILYAANVPFRAGASLGLEYRWRMEQGRFVVWNHEPAEPEPFSWAMNEDGLRFSFENRQDASGDWFLAIPLWSPLLLALVWLYLSWSSSRQNAARYD